MRSLTVATMLLCTPVAQASDWENFSTIIESDSHQSTVWGESEGESGRIDEDSTTTSSPVSSGSPVWNNNDHYSFSAPYCNAANLTTTDPEASVSISNDMTLSADMGHTAHNDFDAVGAARQSFDAKQTGDCEPYIDMSVDVPPGIDIEHGSTVRAYVDIGSNGVLYLEATWNSTQEDWYMVSVDPYNGLQGQWNNSRNIDVLLKVPGETYAVVDGQTCEVDSYANVSFSREFQGTPIIPKIDIDIDAGFDREIQ